MKIDKKTITVLALVAIVFFAPLNPVVKVVIASVALVLSIKFLRDTLRAAK